MSWMMALLGCSIAVCLRIAAANYPPNGAWTTVTPPEVGLARHVRFSVDGRLLLIDPMMGANRSIVLLNSQSLRPASTVSAPARMTCCVLSASNEQVVAGDMSGTISVLSTASKSVLKTARVPTGPVAYIALSPDRNHIAVCGTAVSILNASTLHVERVLKTPGNGALAACYSPDGKTLAVGCYQKVLLYQTAGWKPLPSLRDSLFTGFVRMLAFSHDGRFLVAGVGGSPVGVFLLSTLRRTASIGDGIYAIGMSAKNNLIVAGGHTDKIIIAKIASGKQLDSLSVPRLNLSSLDVSPDGTMIAAVDEGMALRLWQHHAR